MIVIVQPDVMIARRECYNEGALHVTVSRVMDRVEIGKVFGQVALLMALSCSSICSPVTYVGRITSY